ncbi:MAG: hypothetical protein FJX40_14275 [Alphaproteobacteria bacterium]|nr:hypothetical protein [Alphaproteobacteria bacterium]MBM3625634.1 hypothetical protein [Alphaproteobacteria bacterium]
MSEARKKALADPEVRARMSVNIKRAKRGCAVEVPGWAPAELVDDYLDVAASHGEEAAASFVRRLKREMAAHDTASEERVSRGSVAR